MTTVDVVLSKLKRFLVEKESRELLIKSGSSLAIRLSGSVATYVLAFFVTRAYGVSAWGSFMIAFTVLQILAMFSRIGVDKALMMHVAAKKQNAEWNEIIGFYRASLKVILPISACASVLIFLLAPFLARVVFGNESLCIPIQILATGILPLAGLMINAESIRGLRKVLWYAFFEKSGYFLLTAFFFFLAWNYFDTIYLAEISLVTSLYLLWAISFVIWQNEISKKSIGTIVHFKGAEILEKGLPLMLTGSAFLLMSWTDTILLGVFREESEVGLFNIATRLASANSIVLLAVNSFAGPRFSELFARNDARGIRKFARRSSSLIVVCSVPVLALIILFPTFLFQLFGVEEVSTELIIALMVLLTGEAVNSLCGSVGLLLQTTGHQKIFRNIILFSAGFNLLLSLILVPYYGLTGAAIANAISTIVWNVVALYYVKRNLGFLNIYSPLKYFKHGRR
ncbi:MAG: flippase [Flavobacteriales bacterium]